MPLNLTYGACDERDGAFFAGLIAGEGTFVIRANNAGQSWACVFALAMRADETPLLHELRDWAGLGELYAVDGRGRAKPQTRLVVARLRDCVAFSDRMAGLPLLAKKSVDFTVWREAVDHWAATAGRGVAANLQELEARLTRARDYRTTHSVSQVDISLSYLEAFLGGFATAEGHFGASPTGHPRFVINLRRDDVGILECFRDRFELGRLAFPPADAHRIKPVASWRVTKLDDVHRLVELFDRNPPRGVRRDVYAAWRDLVLYAVHHRGRRSSRRAARFRRELAMRVRVARVYRTQTPVSAPDRTAERQARCIAALLEWAADNAGPTTATAYRKARLERDCNWPDRNTIARQFGSWARALEAAGLPTEGCRAPETNARVVQTGRPARQRQRAAQRELILATVKECAEELGHSPRALEFFRWRLQRARDTPSQMTVYRAFPGGWNSVLAAAGLSA